MDAEIKGFVTPVHRALTEPILMGGAPRTVAIANGTLAAAGRDPVERPREAALVDARARVGVGGGQRPGAGVADHQAGRARDLPGRFDRVDDRLQEIAPRVGGGLPTTKVLRSTIQIGRFLPPRWACFG